MSPMSPKATKHRVAQPNLSDQVMTRGLPRKPDAWLVLDLTEINRET